MMQPGATDTRVYWTVNSNHTCAELAPLLASHPYFQLHDACITDQFGSGNIVWTHGVPVCTETDVDLMGDDRAFAKCAQEQADWVANDPEGQVYNKPHWSTFSQTNPAILMAMMEEEEEPSPSPSPPPSPHPSPPPSPHPSPPPSPHPSPPPSPSPAAPSPDTFVLSGEGGYTHGRNLDRLFDESDVSRPVNITTIEE